MITVALIATPEREKKHPDWIDTALLSIHNQTFKDFELIVQQENLSTAENHNKAIARAKGEYIKFVGDDDCLPPWSLHYLHEGIQGYDFVCGNAQTFGLVTEVYKSKPATLEGLLAHNTIHGATTMYRRDMLIELGGYDEELICAEEYDLHLALLKGGYRMGYVDKVVYNYRIHNEQKSNGGLSQELRLIQIEEIKMRYE